MKKAYLLLLSLFTLNGPLAAAQGIALAVYDFKAEGVQQSDAKIIADRLRSELVKAGLTVLERSQMEDILHEQGFQQSGVCTDQSCMVQIGHLLGVNRMVTGSVGKTGNTLTLNVRVVDVGSGKILTTVTEDCACSMDDLLRDNTQAAAQKLAAFQTGKKYVPSKTRKARTFQLVRRIGFGAAAVGFGIGGYWMNMQIDGKMKDNRIIAARYGSAATNAGYASDSSAYKKNWDDAKKLDPVRSLLYGASALGAIGFCISIPF